MLFELLCSCFEVERLGTHEVSLFEGPTRPSKPYVSKRPTDFVHAARVLRWDPNLHVIYMQRDPRDVVVSEHGGHEGQYWCDFPIWQRNQDRLNRLAEHPRLYVCRYEELVTDPDTEQARIARTFPFLTQAHPFSDFERVSQASAVAEKALKGVRGISAASVGSWQRHLPRVAAQLEDHPRMVTEVVVAGYAVDESWAAICSGVLPDRSISVRSQHDELRDQRGLQTLAARIRRRLRSLRDEVLYVAGFRRKGRAWTRR